MSRTLRIGVAMEVFVGKEIFDCTERCQARDDIARPKNFR